MPAEPTHRETFEGIDSINESKLAERGRFEPHKIPQKIMEIRMMTHKWTHKISVPLSPDLSQVVTAWEKLPAPLKAAILAIVKLTA